MRNHNLLAGKRVLIGDRRCSMCGSETTKMRKYKDYAVPEWYKIGEDKWECRRCNNRRYARKQYIENVLKKSKIPGKRRTRAGYFRIKIRGHPRSDKKGWVLEHIVIEEQKIGRSLYPNEQVHHINGIKNDNRPENLKVLDGIEHSRMHGFNRKNRSSKIAISISY